MSLTDNPLAAQFKAFQGFVVKGFSWGGGGGWLQTAFAL